MQDDLRLSAYDYHLPAENIAQFPVEKRDHSRLLVLNRTSGEIEHLLFHQITSLFAPGDLLVINDTRVFPARLNGRKESGGRAEVFLLSYPEAERWKRAAAGMICYRSEALIKSSRPPKPGSKIFIDDTCTCSVNEHLGRGKWQIGLILPADVGLDDALNRAGGVPLPPYIKRTDGSLPEDVGRYQTVYAVRPGAVAAPTAGLHFTDELMQELERKGVERTSVTLHVGYGTFAPVETSDIRDHRIHREYIEISANTADTVNRIKAAGGKIWAVGTTTVRSLESSAVSDNHVQPIKGWCDLYITPGFSFSVIDNLITNFHLPQSSLLFLVSALCGRQTILDCYNTAIEQDYRFFSYGDAMAIIT
jgi:S-adenosylmethionine:tRNA ribosyltransferase-isomerase